MIFPDMYCKNVQSVDIGRLKYEGLEGVAIDVDNTLIDYNQVLSDEVKNWVEKVKKSGLKICILSNSNNKNKVQKVATALDLEYVMVAKKPFKSGFKKACNLMKLDPVFVAVIGDQLFTDVIGANRMGMFSVYVEPINKKEYWYTKWKRPLEAFILSKRPNK